MFIEKYPDRVTVYSIGDVSKELCGGPHVKNTSELGTFKIKKEEASSAGIRRIKAIFWKNKKIEEEEKEGKRNVPLFPFSTFFISFLF